MNQVHKENLTAIENALPNRAGLDVEIFGMEGIPEDIVQQHNQRVLTNYHQGEAERRAATGNPASGIASNNAVKKPKFESPSDLKKRLAEHKAAKLAAEQNGEGSSGASTPIVGQAQPAAVQPSTVSAPDRPHRYTFANLPQQVASPTYPPYQQSYAPPPSSTTFSAPTTYNQQPALPYQPPGYGTPPTGYAQSPPPQQPPYGQPPQPYQPLYAQPPQPSFQQPPYPTPNAFSPPPYQGQPPFPNQPYQSQVPQNGYSGQVGAPRAYASASPASPFPHQQRTHSPAQNGLPQRSGSGSLPTAPGLPQRPAVSAPPVNAAQFQQMHQGQILVQHNFAAQSQPQPHPIPSSNEYNPAAPYVGMPRSLSNEATAASSIDDLISSASKQADANAAANVPKAATPKPTTPVPPAAKDEPADDKAAKKDKDKAAKATRLVYSDNEISPEEKMAAMPKYAFMPSQKTVQV